MRNGFGEIENGLSALLVHVERKEVEREDNFLQIMIKSLHELHNKEKSKPSKKSFQSPCTISSMYNNFNF